MCIFFLPTICPFSAAFKARQSHKAIIVRASLQSTSSSNASTKASSIVNSSTSSRSVSPSPSPSDHTKRYLVSPLHTTISFCLAPTSPNPFLCQNMQIRHRSSTGNPAGAFEMCSKCTSVGKEWQCEHFDAMSAEDLMISAAQMMSRKVKEVKSCGCGCEGGKKGGMCTGKEDDGRYGICI